jgi:hypothetical protein
MNRKNIEFHPALVIGLGGTGHGILLKLKKRFIDQFGEVPPVIQFLAIDTTQEAQRQDTSSDGRTGVELEPNDEQFVITVKGANSLLQGKNPHINKWWPTGTRVRTIKSGSQQIRTLGRLALFANYKEIKDRISNKLDEVRKVENKNLMRKKRYLVSDQGGVDVYVVTSLAGGTGSGMFLDVAFITRNIVPSSNITGIFVLSRIFAKLPANDLVKTNTYAALKEIEWLSKLRENESLEVDYGINKIVVSEPPYDMMYLIDSMNETETVIDNYKTLHSQIADGIYLMAGSEIGASSGNTFNNVKAQVATSGLIENRSTGYCSFGVSSCTWKVHEFKRKLRTAKSVSTHNLVEALLGSSANIANVRSDLFTLVQQCSIGENDLLKELGSPTGTGDPETFAYKRGLMRHNDSALSILRAEHPDYLSAVDHYANENARINYERLRAQFLNSLSEYQKKSLSRTDFLSYLSSFSQQLVQTIENTKNELERRAKNADRDAQAINLADVTPSLGKSGFAKLIARLLKFFVGDSTRTDYATLFANKADQHRRLATKVIYCRKAILLLTELRSAVDDIVVKCSDFRLRLEGLLDRLKSQEQKVEGESIEENPFIRMLPNSPEVKHKDVYLTLFADWCEEQHLAMHYLMASSEAEVAQIIGEFIDKEYEKDDELTIDDLLRDEKNKKAIDSEDLLNYLSQAAAPLWLYTKTEVPLERDHITKLAYCGVPNSESPSGKSLKGGWQGGTAPQLISTIDQHRITFFNITYGVPLFALADLKEMKEEYRKKGKPICHLHRDWPGMLPDLFPAHLDKPLVCFTLAQAPAFEFIKKNGNGTYAIYLDHRKPKLLADELEESFNNFKENAEEREEVVRAMTSRLNGQNRTEVRESLEAYKEHLGRLKANNGVSRSSIQFIRTQVQALEGYLRDF